MDELDIERIYLAGYGDGISRLKKKKPIELQELLNRPKQLLERLNPNKSLHPQKYRKKGLY